MSQYWFYIDLHVKCYQAVLQYQTTRVKWKSIHFKWENQSLSTFPGTKMCLQCADAWMHHGLIETMTSGECNQSADSSMTRHLAGYSLVWKQWKAEGIHWDWQQQWWPYCPVVLENTQTQQSHIQAACSIYFQWLGCSRTSQDSPTKQKQI